MAQEASPSGTDVPEENSLDTVLVTGSRATGRTVRNSAAPIDVVSSDALQATGKGNLLDALQSLLPSFNSAAKQSDLEGNIPGVQLRNLSPGYTLVLVNGKRRNNSAYTSVGTFPGQSYTDLSLIPVSAIDHVEVLRDGAVGHLRLRCHRRRVQRHSQSTMRATVAWASSTAVPISVTATARVKREQGFRAGRQGLRESVGGVHRSGRRGSQPDLQGQRT